MHDRHEKLAYIILNENYEAEVEKSLEKFRKMNNSIVAQKVFDETRASESCILQQGEVVCDADQVLDEMSESILSSNDSENILFDNESVLAHSNGFQVSSDAFQPHTSHDSMSNEVLSCASGPICIDPDQSSRAHNMLDELPLPTFILEMAEAAKAAELVSAPRRDNEHEVCTPCDDHNTQSSNNDVVEPSVNYMVEDVRNPTTHNLFGEMLQLDATMQIAQTAHIVHNEPESEEINDQWDDSLEYERQVFAKLGALDNSHFRDIVIIAANRVRFSGLSALLSVNRQRSGQINHDSDEFYDQNLHSERPCFVVSFKSFIMLNTFHSTNFVENVVLPLLLSDIEWFMSSSISKILGVNVYKLKEFGLENDLRSVPNIKELCSWYKHLFGCDHGISRLIHGIQIVILQHGIDVCRTWISMPYDPGILVRNTATLVCPCTLEDKGDFRGEEGSSSECAWELVNKRVVLLTFVFEPASSTLHVAQLLMEVLNGLFIKKLLFLTCKSQLVLTLTLEDNNDFKEVGNDMGLALWWRTYSLICTRNHLIINHIILMTMTFTSFIFDPGGPCDKFWVVTFLSLPIVATSMECAAVWIFYPGGNDDLLEAMSSTSILYTRDLFGIHKGWMFLMFPVYENAIIQSSEGSISMWLRNGSFTVHLEKISKALEHFSPKYVTELYLPLSLIIDSPSNYGNYFVLLLGYWSKSHSETIFVFDPGGANGVNLVMLVSQTPSFKLLKGNLRLAIEWFQKIVLKTDGIHVFDPGIMCCSKVRRLTVLLCFFMLPTSSKTVKCFGHFLGIIWVALQMVLAKCTLEVKGDFKGW